MVRVLQVIVIVGISALILCDQCSANKNVDQIVKVLKGIEKLLKETNSHLEIISSSVIPSQTRSSSLPPMKYVQPKPEQTRGEKLILKPLRPKPSDEQPIGSRSAGNHHLSSGPDIPESGPAHKRQKRPTHDNDHDSGAKVLDAISSLVKRRSNIDNSQRNTNNNVNTNVNINEDDVDEDSSDEEN